MSDDSDSVIDYDHAPVEDKGAKPDQYSTAWKKPVDVLDHVGSNAGSSITSPPPITKGAAGGGAHKVDSDAMRQFAQNLTPLLAMLDAGRKALAPGKLRVPAGNLPHGIALRDAVLQKTTGTFTTGAAAPVSGTLSFLDAAYNAMLRLQTDTRAMADVYDKAEQFSADQTKQLGVTMQDLAGYIGKASGGTLATGTKLTP